MDKRFLGILVGIAVIFAGFVAFSGHSNDKNGSSSAAGATNHVKGQGQKNVTLIEYGDYQCPICEAYYPVVKQVTGQFDAQIHFQFRNLPLVQIHQNAFSAARAAEAANLQGKFWEMHDTLYESANWQTWTQSSNPLASFEAYAKQLGMNVTQFKTDYASSKINDTINADIAAFGKTGQQQATPTFFLDGHPLTNGSLTDSATGAPSADKFAAIINAEIAKKQ